MTAFPWGEGDLHFLTLAGSQAHGTARQGSDVDLRGLCLLPLARRVSPFEAFEQEEGSLPEAWLARLRPALAAHPTAASGLAVKQEVVVYDLAKFIKLCAAANPNALEILFADECDWLWATPLWRRLHAQRHRFLSRAVQGSFLAYGMAQLRKIKTHRAWLLSPPKAKPRREDFGLPANEGALSKDDRNRLGLALGDQLRAYLWEDVGPIAPELKEAIAQRIEAWAEDALAFPLGPEAAEARPELAERALGLPAELVAALRAEKRYQGAMKQWGAYQAWATGRNPARAELERRFGYDTKHAAHLIRLMRMGLEVLATGELRVRRPDAAELLAIRDGALSHEALMAEAEDLEAQMRAALATSPLPAEVDRAGIEALTVSLLLEGGG